MLCECQDWGPNKTVRLYSGAGFSFREEVAWDDVATSLLEAFWLARAVYNLVKPDTKQILHVSRGVDFLVEFCSGS